MSNEKMSEEKTLPAEVNLDYDTILTQIKEEIRLSREYVKEKRIEFRQRFKLYNNQRKQKDKIGDTSIFNVMTTMLAIYYSDEIQATFQGREIGDAPAAANIENVAKFDYDEMELDIINYQVQWDRLFFGVGIRQLSQWNELTKTPIAKHLSALSWLPDPRGGIDAKFYRWNGFEVEYSRGEMTEDCGFFNLNLLPKKDANKDGSEQEQSRIAYRDAQGLSQVDHQMAKSDNATYDMVDHFTILKGSDGVSRKYLVTVDDNVNNIFRLEELEPVTKKEKEDPSRVPFPITLNYYMPQTEDPFGVSIPDLIEDKQRAKSIFKNLRIAAEKANIYPMYLYNRDKILNRRDLDFAFNKFIAVRGDVGNNIVVPLNKATSRLGESLNSEASLDADIEISTGSSKNQQGVMSEQQRTLGEQEIVQANANLRYLLGSKINAWGERRFWKLWYRLYKQNFPETAKKIIRISSAIGAQYSTITRKNFITNEDPDISIKSKLDVENKRNRDRIAFASVAPLFFQDPSLPVSSRNFSKRYMLQLNGLSPEMIEIMVPDTPDEAWAKTENELLSRNSNEPQIKLEEDHLSHIVIHSQAEKTDATMAHIKAHYSAYVASGQRERDIQVQQASFSAGSSAANSAASAGAAAAANIDNNNGKSANIMPPSAA